MPYKNRFLRLTLSGALYTTEAWSAGFTFVHVGTGEPTSGPEIPTALVTASTTFFDAAAVSSAANISLIKLNLIGTDGHYVDQGLSTYHEINPAIAGGVGSPRVIPQAALAVSLRTPHTRGLAHAGRFYLPVPALTVQTDGRIAGSDATMVQTATTAYINTLNGLFPEWRIGVVSNVRTGAENLVTHVACGRVIDTMRTRRKKLPEEYNLGAEITQP